MSRSFVVPLAVLALLQAAVATNVIDLSKTRNVEIQLTNEDVVPKTELKNLAPKIYANGWIGDIEIGNQRVEEIINQRVIVFENEYNSVQSGSVTLKTTGIIHFVQAINEQDSYGVVCIPDNTLGSTTLKMNIRVGSRSKATVHVYVASHFN